LGGTFTTDATGAERISQQRARGFFRLWGRPPGETPRAVKLGAAAVRGSGESGDGAEAKNVDIVRVRRRRCVVRGRISRRRGAVVVVVEFHDQGPPPDLGRCRILHRPARALRDFHVPRASRWTPFLLG
jgi:hypothetical protein